MSKLFVRLAEFGLIFGFAVSSALAEPDWKSVPAKEIPMFYPGPSGYEWVLSRPDHTGALKLGDKIQNCFDCHEYDADVIGGDIVAGKNVGKVRVVLDQNIPEGRRGTFPLKVKAAHDDRKIYLRFEWDAATKPTAGAKADPLNEIKFSMMFDGGDFEEARMLGCWMSCHMDMRTMPDTDAKAKKHPQSKALGWEDGVTKYLPGSRTAINYEQKPRGGWNQLKPPGEIKKALAAGQFLDLMQFRSGNDKPLDGYVLDSRHMTGGKSLVSATGKREGDKWVVTFERLLTGEGTGDQTISAGKMINFGVSIHENYANARYHQVSLGYTLALDDKKAFVNSVDLTKAKAPAAKN